MAPPRQPLPRSVKILGLVSLLNDASSEMIYPLLPAFLTATLHAGPAFLGLVEGLAEAVASLLKIASGVLSDRVQRRKPLVVFGYALASVARPLIAVATAPWHVLAIRFADRVGKGTRGAPRDALLAEAAAAGDRGRAFGFHRAMDHLGATLGPLLAAAVLAWRRDLRLLFALASVPALASVLVLVFGVRETSRPAEDVPGKAAVTAPLPAPFLRYLCVLALFTLGNSSDAFLLLRAQQCGVSIVWIPVLWTAHHLVKAAVSTPAGALSDRMGRRGAIAAGWGIYALAYAGFAVAASTPAIWLLFGVYGLFHALTEGPERALVADLAGAAARGRAFGLYHGVTGAMLLPASLLSGLLWQQFGAAWALGAGAALAALAAGLLGVVTERTHPVTAVSGPVHPA
jgi:MFS family permease